MSGIESGVQLKKTEVQQKKVAADPRTQLMDSIIGGRKLKSAGDRQLAEKKVDPNSTASNVGQILARAFEIRQAVADSDSDGSSDGEWDD